MVDRAAVYARELVTKNKGRIKSTQPYTSSPMRTRFLGVSFHLTFGDTSVLANGSFDTAATTHPTNGNLSLDPKKLNSASTLSSHTFSKTAGRSADRYALPVVAMLLLLLSSTPTGEQATLSTPAMEDGLRLPAALSAVIELVGAFLLLSCCGVPCWESGGVGGL